jgi:hypothetical protein
MIDRLKKYEDPLYYQGKSFLPLTQTEHNELKTETEFKQKNADYANDAFLIFIYLSASGIFEKFIDRTTRKLTQSYFIFGCVLNIKILTDGNIK